MTPVEFTTEDFYQLLGIGVLVSAASAYFVEKLIKPLLPLAIKSPVWRAVVLRLAPVWVCTGFTFALFPLAILFWTPAVDVDQVTWSVLLTLGVIGGAGSSWAYNVWDGIVRAFLEKWTGHKEGTDD